MKAPHVLMFDGRLTSAAALQAGDQVMGPDSRPRTVMAQRRIEEEAYEIRPIKGQSFMIGASQRLPLMFANTPTSSFTLQNYWSKPPRWRSEHCLYRVAVNFEHVDDLPLDPYFLGLLLGDGCFRHITPKLTGSDPEIAAYVFDMAEALGVRVCVQQQPTNAANQYYFSSQKGQVNYLTIALKALGLYGKFSSEKFIPHPYKTGSIETRAAVLAGLLDTDGYLAHRTFEYSTASKQLVDDVTFVARSLGFMAYPKEKIVNGVLYYRFCICGDFAKLPLKVGRKIPETRTQKRPVLHTGFTVHSLGVQPCAHLIFQAHNTQYLKADFMVMEGDTL